VRQTNNCDNGRIDYMVLAPAAFPASTIISKDFGEAISNLDASFRKLLQCEPFTFNSRPQKLPFSVVYLFSNDGQPIYVGRSNKFRQRLGNHCLEGSQPNQASLAFRLACEDIQHTRKKYQRGSSPFDALKTVPDLADAFVIRKKYLKEITIQYVEEEDQVRQSLLEMYAAISLKAAHDFGTH
jgi:hypothetical protein